MILLEALLEGIAVVQTVGQLDKPVSGLTLDSRKVEQGFAFVAVRGALADGHNYIDKAISLGASVVVCETLPEASVEGVVYVAVQNSHEAVGKLASNFYGKPSEKLKLVGITGTNGKTSVATLLFQLFRELGYRCGLLSTVENKIEDKVYKTSLTTPDPVSLNALLAEMLQQGCTHCFMEVSSHAVVQRRIAGLVFNGGVFTNISHDHLDYHKTFAEYIKAKKGFFDELPKNAFALVNGDDKRGSVMLQNTDAKQMYFALKSPADFKGKIVLDSLQGLEMELDGHNVWFQLVGRFNAYNLLAVYGVAVSLGEDPMEVLSVLSKMEGAKGRFERVISSTGILGIVDYAHTPDALENVLKTIEECKGGGQVITVVGCGGDRDREKRPKMAAIAAKFSDRVVLTSDNPRSEDPKEILKEMEAGLSPTDRRKNITLEDRREAIKLACSFANPHDVVLIAGKGHEDYQEIQGVRHHFDDREELLSCFELLQK